jgi:stress-induced morphogen
VHEKKKPHACPICDRAFSVKKDLKRHTESVHEGKKPFQCNICPKKFTDSRILKRHLAMVHELGKSFEEGDIICDICNAIFTTQSGLNGHIAAMHGNFECGECKTFFTNKYLMKRHIERVHEEKKPAFSCPICDASFMSKQGMQRHILSTHEGVKPFECDICRSKFAQSHGLKKHKAAYHDSFTIHIKENNIDSDGAPIFQENDSIIDEIKIENRIIRNEIKEEPYNESEEMPIQDSTRLYIKQEEFNFIDSQNEEENGMIVREIKEEICYKIEATPTVYIKQE